ncbi:unnamed protein product [Paramecium primaurelia]|uniref:Uncharacterized protein n=1 Tax=Paramecium primaurelia TaxID=5886 RepID=A0A8S1NW26_PARPR|nr:unnamed protein product [Paramecium primaurelia]
MTKLILGNLNPNMCQAIIISDNRQLLNWSGQNYEWKSWVNGILYPKGGQIQLLNSNKKKTVREFMIFMVKL